MFFLYIAHLPYQTFPYLLPYCFSTIRTAHIPHIGIPAIIFPADWALFILWYHCHCAHRLTYLYYKLRIFYFQFIFNLFAKLTVFLLQSIFLQLNILSLLNIQIFPTTSYMQLAAPNQRSQSFQAI